MVTNVFDGNVEDTLGNLRVPKGPFFILIIEVSSKILNFKISEPWHSLQFNKIPEVSNVIDGVVKDTGGS